VNLFQKIIAFMIAGGVCFALFGWLIAQFMQFLNDLLRPPRDLILIMVVSIAAILWFAWIGTRPRDKTNDQDPKE